MNTNPNTSNGNNILNNSSKQIRSMLPNNSICIFLASIVAWACTVTSVTRCTFIVQQTNLLLDDEMILSSSTTTTPNYSQEMGMFSRSVYDDNGSFLGCVSYTNTEPDFFDTMFKIARSSAVLSTICTSIVLLCITTAVLFCPRNCKSLWSWSRFLLAAGTILQLFTFTIMNSSTHCQGEEHTCRLTGVGKLAIFNVLFMAGLTVMVFWENRPFHPTLYFKADAFDTDTIMSDRTTTDPYTVPVNTNHTTTTITKQQQPWNNHHHDEDLLESGQVLMNDSNPYGRRRVMEEEEKDRKCDSYYDTTTTNNNNNQIHRGVTSSSLTSFSSQEPTEPHTLSIQHLRSFRFLTILLVTVAWITSIIGVSRCTLILVGPINGSRSDFSGLGLYSRAAYQDANLIGCLAYPEEVKQNFDVAFQSSRVFAAITAFLMTAIFFLVNLLLFIQRAKEEIWIIMRMLLPCAMICQLLVFVAFRTETCSEDSDLVQCSPGPTSIIVIFNLFLLVLLSIGFCMIPPPPGPIFRFHSDRDTSTVTSRHSREYGPTTTGMNNTTTRKSHKRPLRHGQRVVAVDDPPGSPISATSLDLPSLQHSSCTDTSNQNTNTSATDSNGNVPKRVRITTEPAETIMVQVEYSEKERRTTKTITHPDGSKTITTTIEKFSDDSNIKKNKASVVSSLGTSKSTKPPIEKVKPIPVVKTNGLVSEKPDAVTNPVASKPTTTTAVAAPITTSVEAPEGGGPQVPEFFLKLNSLKKTNCLSAQEMAEQARQESSQSSTSESSTTMKEKSKEVSTQQSPALSSQSTSRITTTSNSTEVRNKPESSRPVLPKSFFEPKVSVSKPTSIPSDRTEQQQQPPIPDESESPLVLGVKNLRQMFEKGASA